MLSILTFVYSIFQIILFTIVSSFSIIYFFRKKNPFFIALTALFAFYILDVIVILMTEFVPTFTTFYNSTFLSVPAFKTIIYTVTSFCIAFIYNSIFYEEIEFSLYLPVILLTLIWLFIPMFPVDSLRVYIYYEVYQLYTLWIGILAYKNCHTNKVLAENHSLIRLSLLLIFFSVVIAIEDYIVIFYFDSYVSDTITIQSRCYTEDIFRFILSFYLIYYLSNKIFPHLQKDVHKDSFIIHNPLETTTSSLETVETNQNESLDTKFDAFCKKYDLTTREQEILKLILSYKSAPEIGEILYIAPGTAKTHMHKIYQKIGVAKRNQLISVYNEYSI